MAKDQVDQEEFDRVQALSRIALEAVGKAERAEKEQLAESSPQEAWMDLRLQLDVLGDVTFAQGASSPEARAEAIKLAGMVVRYVRRNIDGGAA